MATTKQKEIQKSAGNSSCWIKQSSKKHPGKFYYFNVRTGESTWNSPHKIESSQSANEKESVLKRLFNPKMDKLRKVKESGIVKKNLAQDRLKKLQSILAKEALQSDLQSIAKASSSKHQETLQLPAKNLQNTTRIDTNSHSSSQSAQERLKKLRSKLADEATLKSEFPNKLKTDTDKPLKVVNVKVASPKKYSPEKSSSRKRKASDDPNNETKGLNKPSVDERLKIIRRTTSQDYLKENNKKVVEDKKDQGNVIEKSEKGIVQTFISTLTNVSHSVKSFFRLGSNEDKNVKKEDNQLKSPANERLNKFRDTLETEHYLEDYDVIMSDVSSSAYLNETLDKTLEVEEMDWQDIPEELALQEVTEIRQDNKNDKNLRNDVDFSQGNNICSEYQQLGRHFFIVIDTNVFLSHLKSIDYLLQKQFKHAGQAILVIPYIVLQELDSIKTRKSDDNIGAIARKSVLFLNTMFKNKDQRVQGQSAIQAKNRIVEIENADDNIVNCCLQVTERIRNSTQTGVILLSNDNNLRNKALVNKIDAFSFSELLYDADSLKFGS